MKPNSRCEIKIISKSEFYKRLRQFVGTKLLWDPKFVFNRKLIPNIFWTKALLDSAKTFMPKIVGTIKILVGSKKNVWDKFILGGKQFLTSFFRFFFSLNQNCFGQISWRQIFLTSFFLTSSFLDPKLLLDP